MSFLRGDLERVLFVRFTKSRAHARFPDEMSVSILFERTELPLSSFIERQARASRSRRAPHLEECMVILDG